VALKIVVLRNLEKQEKDEIDPLLAKDINVFRFEDCGEVCKIMVKKGKGKEACSIQHTYKNLFPFSFCLNEECKQSAFK
jgi:hypothetical protein